MNRSPRWLRPCLIILCCGGWIACPASGLTGERMVVHEWGTFTTLQSDAGKELPGINIDDEPVPDFVHNLSPYLLNKPLLSNVHWQFRQKAAPRQHPYVTMRLETPVIYFHLPEGNRRPTTLDVSVSFHGGWLTEFYPHADASAPGLKEGRFDFGPLTPETVGGLAWRGLKVGVEPHGPATTENVWLAPRKVNSAGVETPGGESENYLFYRGVANLHAPLRVATNRTSNTLTIYGNFDDVLSEGKTERIGSLWLAHIRPDGSCAFRTLDPISVSKDRNRSLGTVSSQFEEKEYSAENLKRMKEEMHKSLVADGLFADEATALLATWQRAYFVSPGLRLFFLVPQSWTDHYLPLSISKEADIDRVMVGRIELMTEAQRNSLARLAQTAASDGTWIELIPPSPAKDRFLAGRSDFGNLGVAIPPDYQMYLGLGRFRNALVTNEERQRPTENLRKFIDTYGLHPFRWRELEPALGKR